MCIRDRVGTVRDVELLQDTYLARVHLDIDPAYKLPSDTACLLYTSDAADDLLCVDLGGRRILKKKKQKK